MTANEPHNVSACTTKLFSTARLCLDPDTPSPSTASRPSSQRTTLTASSGPPKRWVPMTSPASTSSTNAVSENLMLCHIYVKFCCKTHSSAGEITIIWCRNKKFCIVEYTELEYVSFLTEGSDPRPDPKHTRVPELQGSVLKSNKCVLMYTDDGASVRIFFGTVGVLPR